MLGLGFVSANCVAWGQNQCSGGSVAVGTGLLALHCLGCGHHKDLRLVVTTRTSGLLTLGCGHHKDLRLVRPALCGLRSPQGPQACSPWVVVTTRTSGLFAPHCVGCGHQKDLRLARPTLCGLWSPQGPQALLAPHCVGCGHHKDLCRLETAWC